MSNKRLQDLRAAAKQGDVQAQTELGLAYLKGDGVTKNKRASARWFRKAAEQGFVDAQNHLATAYLSGWGVAKSDREAVRWWHKAAKQGHVESQVDLGEHYEVRGSLKKSAHWYDKAAKQGDADAQYKMGDIYRDGGGVARDRRQAVCWYLKAAKQGHVEAQYNLGCAYALGAEWGNPANSERAYDHWIRTTTEGEVEITRSLLSHSRDGVDENQAESMWWYRKAAAQNHVEAQHALGRHYELGQGVAVDESEAVRWYQKAAEQGDAEAQYDLGRAYQIGKGVAEDISTALHWYRAAGLVHTEAQRELARAYEHGLGIAQDKIEAVRWYRRADEGDRLAQWQPDFLEEAPAKIRKRAEQGDAEAQYNLGWEYFDTDVAETCREGVRWWRKAAKQGNVKAQELLGDCYLKGKGVLVDEREAHMWLSIAKESGSEYAAEILSQDFWYKILSQYEIRLARRAARRKMEKIDRRKAGHKKSTP